ncbi:putative 4-mercaptohistidine N1-methyltransferase [Phragmitibacter flavus]|uniref:putative 4-mercaptohistidine N1-methyltransferase n=1 Tax=Phragmitibacter flavus TaxID=2576071 RepID=UPI001980015A|nr:putative 4-mercaptohistidine N1-methyltransferase [Phragmitibacter flavus]
MIEENIYETPKLHVEYLLFHYGSDEEVLPWENGPKEALGFATRTVSELLRPELLPETAGTRALDLGCAVGRSSFELSKVVEEVIGIDYSMSFIETAEHIRQHGSVSYPRVDEGDSFTPCTAHRPEGSFSERVKFEQGDAMLLREDLGSFDVVHAANLLCRLADPQRLLQQLPALVKPGGQLLLATPCSWLEEFTPKDNWPVGSTFEWLKERLLGHFELDEQKDLPFLIREHARKYQWSVALGTRWIRRSD